MNADLSAYTFGKIQPQAKELEEAVLGAMMLEKHAISKVMSIITYEAFYVTANRMVFNAIERLYKKGKEVDILTVTEELKQMSKLEDVGGAYYVTELTSRIASAANVEEHARIVAQKFFQREIIRISSDAIKQAYEDTTDVFNLLDYITLQLVNVNSKITKNSAKHISGPAKENYFKIDAMSKNPGKLLGHSTGIKSLDEALHGIQPGVIVIAARPSMGKSALMAQIATSAAEQGIPVQIFTLEVNAGKYELRMKTQMTQIHFSRIQTGNIRPEEWAELESVTEKISELPIWIDDAATISMVQLRSKCLQAYSERGVRMFAIDFIQLADGGDDNGKLSEMSRAVKIISQELNVPFLELSQLSREVEKRQDKKPLLSDLRNSGSLEADADVVMLLYRPEYYGLPAQDRHRNSVDSKGFAQIRIAKNKDGNVATVDLTFKGENLLFSDYVAPVISISSPPKKSNIKINPYEAEKPDDAVPF